MENMDKLPPLPMALWCMELGSLHMHLREECPGMRPHYTERAVPALKWQKMICWNIVKPIFLVTHIFICGWETERLGSFQKSLRT